MHKVFCILLALKYVTCVVFIQDIFEEGSITSKCHAVKYTGSKTSCASSCMHSKELCFAVKMDGKQCYHCIMSLEDDANFVLYSRKFISFDNEINVSWYLYAAISVF